MNTATTDGTSGSTWVAVQNSSESWDDSSYSHTVGTFRSAEDAQAYIDKKQAANNAAMEALGDLSGLVSHSVWYHIDEVPFVEAAGETVTVYSLSTTRNEDTGDREITEASFHHVPVAKMTEDKTYAFLMAHPDKAYAETPDGYIPSEIFPPMVLDAEGTWFEEYEENFDTLSPQSLVLKAPEGYVVPELKPPVPHKYSGKISTSGLDALLDL